MNEWLLWIRGYKNMDDDDFSIEILTFVFYMHQHFDSCLLPMHFTLHFIPYHMANSLIWHNNELFPSTITNFPFTHFLSCVASSYHPQRITHHHYSQGKMAIMHREDYQRKLAGLFDCSFVGVILTQKKSWVSGTLKEVKSIHCIFLIGTKMLISTPIILFAYG